MTDTLEKEPVSGGPEARGPVQKRIVDAFASRGIDPTPERQQRLTEKAEGFHATRNEEYNPGFMEDGLFIFAPVDSGGSDPKKISKIEFLPKTKKSHGATLPQRGEVSRLTTNVFHAFQDHALLAEAGFFDPPDRLFGQTNPTMERIGKRLGFAPSETMPGMIEVDYAVLQDRLFAPETAAAMATIERFQQTRPETVAPTAGQVALAS